MRKTFFYVLILLLSIVSGKNQNTNKKSARALGVEHITSTNNSNRYETSVYFRDFEGDVSDWLPDGGWMHSDGNSSSPVNSFNSPNDATTDAIGTAQDSARAYWNMLSPDIEEKVIGSAEILEIFKVSKVGKVAGSKVTEGEILQDSNARVIRDGTIIFNGKIGSIFREQNQAKQVSAGLECGITIKNFNDFQKKDIIEVYNSTITERTI